MSRLGIFFFLIRFKMKKLLLFLTLLLPASIWAQSAAVKKIQQMAKEDNQVMKHLDILCNRFGGRVAGSDAYENAAEWAIQCFEKWGLEVTTEEAGQTSVGFNRGGWWGYQTGEEQHTLHFVTPSYTSGTKGPQKGHVVIEPRTAEQVARVKHLLKGSWVLLNGHNRGWSFGYGPWWDNKRKEIIAANAEAEKWNRQHAGEDGERKPIDDDTAPLFYNEMVEAGILGFVQKGTTPLTALYDRDVIGHNIPFDSLPTVPNIILDEYQFDHIYRMAKERRHVELNFDIRNHFKLGPVKYHNIIATIKGSKYPDEYVLVGAHLDAFDVATGGVDCGSGVSVVMEAARMISQSGAKPERTIVFILFAAEEFGLIGSQAWLKAHPDKADKISNMFNRDGGPMPYTSFSAPKSLVKEYEKIAEPIQELYPDYNFTIRELEPRQKPTELGGNDASTFAVAGIPALQMSEWTDVKGYGFSYGEIWHTERDTYQKSIPEYQEQAATAMALMVLGTANLSKKLPREEVYK